MLAKHWSKLLVMALIVSLVIYISCSDESLTPVDDNVGGTLTVKHISPADAPVIGENDGGFDVVWSQADTFYVIVNNIQEGNTRGSQFDIVRLLALTDSTHLYLMAIWNDNTRDVRPDRVVYENKVGGHSRKGGQDFFYAIMDDGGNGDVGSDCNQMCHQTFEIFEDDTTIIDSMINPGPGIVDAWLWTSGQSDPVGLLHDLPGTLLDMSFASNGIPEGDETHQIIPAWELNADPQQPDLPRWMHPDSNSYKGDFLFNSEKVQFTQTDITYLDTLWDYDWEYIYDEDSTIIDSTIIDSTIAEINTEFGWPLGAEIPGYVLADSVWHTVGESRFEVYAKGTYRPLERRWYLELRRQLNPVGAASGEDIVFSLDEAYEMTIGVTNNPGGNSPMPHYGSEPFRVQF
jgi:hypothetical protein